MKANKFEYENGKLTYVSEAKDSYEYWAKGAQLPKINGTTGEPESPEDLRHAIFLPICLCSGHFVVPRFGPLGCASGLCRLRPAGTIVPNKPTGPGEGSTLLAKYSCPACSTRRTNHVCYYERSFMRSRLSLAFRHFPGRRISGVMGLAIGLGRRAAGSAAVGDEPERAGGLEYRTAVCGRVPLVAVLDQPTAGRLVGPRPAVGVG